MNGTAAEFEDGQQAQFELRWGHLRDPHVRSLAWLIDSPVLLDADDPAWKGQIANLPDDAAARAAAWLAQLDKQPQDLHALIADRPTARLGRYAEQLMAFYFSHLGTLFAHGLQVRDNRSGSNVTAGEFDFLLHSDAGLVHWEFATKFYLLERPDGAAETVADYFIGPNLADTLGAKMQKILGRQLALGDHPAAREMLPMPVVEARALVKGWLFYHGRIFQAPDIDACDDGPAKVLSQGAGSTAAVAKIARPGSPAGVARAHCCGFWSEAAVFHGDVASDHGHRRYAILSRLSWLAPALVCENEILDATTLTALLQGHFENDVMPVMVALVAGGNGKWREIRRGFVVPDNWRLRAGELRRGPGLS